MNRYETYQFIGSCLALDFNPDSREAILSIIGSDSVNWKRFFKIGSNHLVLQTLWRIFQTHQIALPLAVEDELRTIYNLNRERNKHILEQALEINRILEAIDIYPVFLKGVAHLMNGLYKDPAERILADIDLLIARDEIKPAVEALEKEGYLAPIKLSSELEHIYKKHHPRLYKPDLPGYIEIHWDAVRKEYSKNFTYSDLVNRKKRSKEYSSCYTMSVEDSVMHNFIHSQLEHKGHFYARVYIRNLYDLLLLSPHCNLDETFESFGRYLNQSSSYLQVAERTFNVPLTRGKNIKIGPRIFLLRHKLNVRMITFSFIMQLISRFYISYIKKSYLIITKKDVRKLTRKNLSNRQWYKQHFSAYKNIFGTRK